MKNNKEKRIYIDYNFDWEYGVDINKIREDLDTLEDLGATHLMIEGVDSYNVPHVSIVPFFDKTN